MSTSNPDRETPIRKEDLQQFVIAVSHDLREPLRTIRCFADLMMRRGGTLERDESNRFCAYISDAAKRMQRLLDDMLAFSLAEGPAAELSDVDMGNVLQFALSSLKPVIVETMATVTSDPLPVVTGNFGALAEVFQNLIGNAIKYHGKEKPRIHINCTRSRADWTFAFADNGIGIAPEHRDEVLIPLKPAALCATIPWNRPRPCHLQTHYRMPRRPYMGRVRSGSWRDVLFHDSGGKRALPGGDRLSSRPEIQA